MGSWGTAILSDDVADVRVDWRERILDRILPEELTAKLGNSYAAQADDPDDGVVFWLALAVAQHETGRTAASTEARESSRAAHGGAADACGSATI